MPGHVEVHQHDVGRVRHGQRRCPPARPRPRRRTTAPARVRRSRMPPRKRAWSSTSTTTVIGGSSSAWPGRLYPRAMARTGHCAHARRAAGCQRRARRPAGLRPVPSHGGVPDVPPRPGADPVPAVRRPGRRPVPVRCARRRARVRKHRQGRPADLDRRARRLDHARVRLAGLGLRALADCPAFSWATGNNASRQQLLHARQGAEPLGGARAARTSGTAGGNDAVTGAKMTNLARPGDRTRSARPTSRTPC